MSTTSYSETGQKENEKFPILNSLPRTKHKKSEVTGPAEVSGTVELVKSGGEYHIIYDDIIPDSGVTEGINTDIGIDTYLVESYADREAAIEKFSNLGIHRLKDELGEKVLRPPNRQYSAKKKSDTDIDMDTRPSRYRENGEILVRTGGGLELLDLSEGRFNNRVAKAEVENPVELLEKARDEGLESVRDQLS